jgi:hypothetical protein
MMRLRGAKGWRNSIVCLLIGQLLVVAALAASPQLHQLLHHDADHSDHACAVTVMLSGGSDGCLSPQILETGAILLAAFSYSLGMRFTDVSPLFLDARIFEHAPPVA